MIAWRACSRGVQEPSPQAADEVGGESTVERSGEAKDASIASRLWDLSKQLTEPASP
jgi:hypothetical protein